MVDAIITKTGMQRLIFTDLDGTLLDHDNYSYEPAANLLEKLNNIGIPVIPTTSKTRSEVLPLRRAINNEHPFITENGAGIYIPKDYFSFVCDSWIDKGTFGFNLAVNHAVYGSALSISCQHSLRQNTKPSTHFSLEMAHRPSPK